jgi:hypothetical protein
VNRASLSFRAAWRIRARSLGALTPALGPERVSLAAFPSADPLPSTDSATPPWALFAGFAGTTGSSDFPRSCITGLRPWPCPHDPPNHHHKRVIVGPPGSRAWRLRACTGSWTPRGPPTARESAAGRCCLPLIARASAPRLQPISGLDSPAYAYPYRRFAHGLTTIDARLGATVDRYSFDVELFHLLLHAGLSRRRRKLIYLAVTNAAPQWTRCRNWTTALLAFKIHFGDRLPDTAN